MDLAITSLRIIIGVTLVAVVALFIVGGFMPESIVWPSVVAFAVQGVALYIVLIFLRKGWRGAALLFVLFCLNLLIGGITAPFSVISIIDYGLATVGFVGIYGVWTWWRHERPSQMDKGA
jgi:hypothetical protein